MISEAALLELKDRNPCDQVAAKWVALRRHGASLIGPCPICSENRTSRKATKFQCWPDRWACAGACSDGGDVIKLVMKVEGLDFRAAIDWLGGAQEIDAAKAAEREKEHAAARELAEKESNVFRERARGKAFDTWRQGKPLPGSPVEQYLRLRGLSALPERLLLRFAPQLAYFHGEEVNEIGRKAPRIIYRGPAMLAPIVDAAGKFRALHTTWLDLDQSKGKALIEDPESPGDELPAKKVRGSKLGNRIELVPIKDPAQLIIGEGIETVLSVWLALERAGQDLARTAFWSAVDLGNLGGRAAKTVSDPMLKSDAGRALRVPGPEPDSDSRAIAIPDTVADVVLLGDGDSGIKTECALVRAAARWARPSRVVRLAWAPPGQDFNDLLRAAV
jgi:hypothetical protein